jgi:intein/homing endonuclease
MPNYTPLHVHSDYSIKDSIAKVPDLVKKAKSLGMESICLSDHGSISGWIKLYESCKKENIKSILGIEAYIVDDHNLIHRINKKLEELKVDAKDFMPLFAWAESNENNNTIKEENNEWSELFGNEIDPNYKIQKLEKLKESRTKNNHILLIAKNQTGYKNILKLSSIAWTEGFYYKPRVDLKLLEKYKEGLIVCSACLGGQIAYSLLMKDRKKAEEYTKEYKRIFGDDFYLELQLHNTKEQKIVNKQLIEIAKKYDIKTVITQDVHYLDKQDIELHKVMIKLKNKQTDSTQNEEVKDEDDGYFYETDELYFKSYDELVESWKQNHDYISENDFNNSIENTNIIANKIEKIQVVNPNPLLPKFDCGELTSSEFIKKIIKDGFEKKVKSKITDPEQLQVYKDRLNEEIKTIFDLKFEEYFLIIWDIINWCKNNDVAVGAARGCLTPNSMIFSNEKLKKIKDIEIGDIVITDDGKKNKVINKFEYKTKEEVIKINHLFCDYYETPGYTKDHKILAIKNKKTNFKNNHSKKFIIPLSNKNNKINKNYYISKDKQLNNIKPQYIKSENLERGDFLCIPITKYNFIDIEYFDLDPKNTNLNQKYIIERTNNNKKSNLSTRAIAKEIGCTKITVQRILNEEIKNGKDKLLNIINKNGIKTLKEYKNIVKNNRYQENRILKLIKCDELFLTILGMYISDGYETNNGIAFHSNKNKKQRKILREFCKIYGFKFKDCKHKQEKLIQTYIYSKSLKSLFNNLVKRHAINKNIHDNIKNLPLNKLKYLIKGLMLGDGHIKKHGSNSSCYDSINESLVVDIKEILIKLGIPSSIHKRLADGKKIIHDSYKLMIATNKLFGENKKYNYLIDENYIYIPITDVNKENYIGYVYDLQIENNHSFRTNQYIVHNSAGGSLVSYCMDITKIDPIFHNLIFSRFINKSRSMAKYKLNFNDPGLEIS